VASTIHQFLLNGSIRFELDRPENKDCIEAFKSIEKIKAAVDAVTTQPLAWLLRTSTQPSLNRL